MYVFINSFIYLSIYLYIYLFIYSGIESKRCSGASRRNDETVHEAARNKEKHKHRNRYKQ